VNYVGQTTDSLHGAYKAGPERFNNLWKENENEEKNGERIITPRGLVCAEDNFH